MPGLSQAADRQISHSSSGRSIRENKYLYVDQAFFLSIVLAPHFCSVADPDPGWVKNHDRDPE